MKNFLYSFKNNVVFCDISSYNLFIVLVLIIGIALTTLSLIVRVQTKKILLQI